MTAIPLNPDVIVVGAGTAGLSAAQALMAAGFSVLVVEAAGHAGGRAVTNRDLFDVPFDEGGSWLHSAATNPLARLAEKNDVGLHRTPWRWSWVSTEGRALTSDEVASYNTYQDDMWQAIVEAGRGPVDARVLDTLPPSPWRSTARHWVQQLLGADADVTSAMDVARFEDTGGDWLVSGGLGAFVQSLFSEVHVVLDCPVTEIDMTGPGIRAVTPKGVAHAKALVLTVSTGVLMADAIRFTPALPPEKQAALSDLPIGLLNKIGLEFDPAWQDAGEGQTADYLQSGEAYCTLLFGFYGTSQATGFVAGRFADLLEAEGPGAATAFCLDALCEIFGSQTRKYVKRTAETAWRANALTAGSYSYARPDRADARTILAAPLNDRLFFAGEATEPTAYATVHGAYLSGQRAAREVRHTIG